MVNQMIFELTAVLISLLALIFSLISLWHTHFSPFRLKINHDVPTFALYKITPDMSGNKFGKTWWIPSFDLGVSFRNLGQQIGEVMDLRILAELTSKENVIKHTFYPVWVVDYNSFWKNRLDRFKWIECSVIREWYPFTLAGKESISMHLVLEHLRWDTIETGLMAFCLEAFCSQTKRWLELGRYSLHITKDLYETGSSCTPYDPRLEKRRGISTKTE